MDEHTTFLEKLCRICKNPIHSDKNRGKESFSSEISELYSLDISDDISGIHPHYICSADASKLYQYRKAKRSGTTTNITCTTACASFTSHSTTNCSVCHASDQKQHNYGKKAHTFKFHVTDHNVDWQSNIDRFTAEILGMSHNERQGCVESVVKKISCEERAELSHRIGCIIANDMPRPNNDTCGMNSDKDILSLATMNSTDYVRNQSSALINFICRVTQVDISKVDTDKKLAFQISVACEQLQKISSPMYVGPASLLQNLNIFAITNSKLALNILGNVVPSGRYNTVFNWLSQQANVPLKCPPGDLVVMFDNEEIVGKTWSIKPNNKLNMSIITNVAAVPLTSNTTLQDRSDLHPRKWLTRGWYAKTGGGTGWCLRRVQNTWIWNVPLRTALYFC